MNLDNFLGAKRSLIRRFDHRAKSEAELESLLENNGNTRILSDQVLIPRLIDLKEYRIIRNLSQYYEDKNREVDFDLVAAVMDAISYQRSQATDSLMEGEIVICELANVDKLHKVKAHAWEIIALGLLYIRDIHQLNRQSFDRLVTIQIYDSLITLLDHPEPRVRNLLTAILRLFLNTSLGIDQKLYQLMVERIQGAIDRHVSTRNTSLGDEATIAMDDTTGWQTLESDILVVNSIIIEFLASRSSRIDMMEEFQHHTIIDLLIHRTGLHLNRHIRQNCLSFIKILTDTIRSLSMNLDSMKSHPLFPICVEVLAVGLEDDWSQIRREAILASQSVFVIFLPSSSMNELLDMQMYPKLLPKLCLSRFYTAEGVRSSAQTAWAAIVSSSGKDLLIRYISQVVATYTKMSCARNHMVSEAACHAMAEIALKLPHEIVDGYARELIVALQAAMLQNSWPIRDAACLSLGRILNVYPTVSCYSISKCLLAHPIHDAL
jgi:hypothetical protein